MSEDKCDSAVVRDVMAQFFKPAEVVIGSLAQLQTEPVAMAVPAGMSLVSLKKLAEEYLTRPERRSGTAKLLSQQSFIDWTNRFKAPNSAIFVNNRQAAPSLTAIIDYHPESPDNDDARWAGHRGHYAFPLSKQWQTWAAIDGKTLSQVDLGNFLEDHILDVLPAPGDDEADGKFRRLAQALGGRWGTPGELLNAARHFEINEKSELISAPNVTTGEITLSYKTSQTDPKTGGAVSLSNLYLLAIPVFEGEVAFRMPIRIRHRKVGTGVTFTIIRHRPDVYFDEALNEAVKTVAEGTQLPVFVGAPENGGL